jgi:hypothetical protein
MIALSPLLEVFRDRYSLGNISAEPKSSAFTLGVIESPCPWIYDEPGVT